MALIVDEPILFPFDPNWADPVWEENTYFTGITVAWSGKESRRSWRQEPNLRVGWSCMTLQPGESGFLHTLLYGSEGKQFLVPLWADETLLDAPWVSSNTMSVTITDQRFVAGTFALLYRGPFDFQVITVFGSTATTLVAEETPLKTWPLGTRVVPLRPARLALAIQQTLAQVDSLIVPVVFDVEVYS